MGLDRLELSTSRLSGVRSNHLSYRPFLNSFLDISLLLLLMLSHILLCMLLSHSQNAS